MSEYMIFEQEYHLSRYLLPADAGRRDFLFWTEWNENKSSGGANL